MPYQISWDGHADVEVVYSGLTSDVEMLEVVHRLYEDERFATLRRILHDLSGVEACAYSWRTLSEIDVITVGASFTNRDFRIAYVAGRKDLSDMFKLFMDIRYSTCPMQVFPTAAHAKAWLAASASSG